MTVHMHIWQSQVHPHTACMIKSANTLVPWLLTEKTPANMYMHNVYLLPLNFAFLCVCVCVLRRDVQECVPSPFYSKQGSQPWLNMTTQHMQQVQPLNPHQARAQFLGKTLC